MKKEGYKTMIETILNDETYHSKSNINPEMDLQLKYKRFLKYLQNLKVKISNFYGLTKVH